MPIVKTEDYPDGDTSLDYCVHCGTKDGIYPYGQLLEGMSQFIQNSQGMEKEQAGKVAKEMIDNSEAVKVGKVKKE